MFTCPTNFFHIIILIAVLILTVSLNPNSLMPIDVFNTKSILIFFVVIGTNIFAVETISFNTFLVFEQVDQLTKCFTNLKQKISKETIIFSLTRKRILV